MDKKNIERLLFFVSGVLVVVFCIYFYEISEYISNRPLLKFVASSSVYVIPLITAFFIYWYQKKVEREDKFNMAMLSTMFSLGGQFESSVNMLCGSINSWFEGGSIAIANIAYTIGVPQKIDKNLLCDAKGLSIEIIQDIFALEDKLLWLYSVIENINNLIDISNHSEGSKKRAVHKELIDQVDKVLEYSIKYSVEFNRVMNVVVSEMKKKGAKIEVKTDGVYRMVASAEATKMFINKYSIQPYTESPKPRISVQAEGDSFIVGYPDGKVVKYDFNRLLMADYDQFISIIINNVGVDAVAVVNEVLLRHSMELFRNATRKREHEKDSGQVVATPAEV